MPRWSPSSGPEPTLEQLLLATGQRLEIWCCRHTCRHEAFWTPTEAIARLGPNCTIRRAEHRLRCAKCGARGREREVMCRPSVTDFYDRRWAEAAGRQDPSQTN
jgi:hypothetical protein